MSLIKSKSSFEKVVKEHQEAIRRLFLNLTLGDEMLSDDLAQDTFIKAYNNWNTFKMLSSVRTWLFRIAYNTFYDYRRGLKMTSDIDKLSIPQNANTDNNTLKLDIYQAMKLLSENERLDVLPSNGIILPTTTVTFYEGESVFDVLQRVCKAHGIQMESSGTPMYGSAYVEGIGNLYEFDCGSGSGWMYRVNGWYPNYGCSRYMLQQGEIVEWRYTCDLGADIGGGYAIN